MNAVKLLGLLCVTALVASAAVGAEGDGIVVAFTFFPLLRSETEALEKRQSAVDRIFDRYVSEICITLDEISHIYNRTLVALFRQNTRVLRDMSRRSAKLCREAEARRRAGVTLQRGGVSDMGAWLFGTRATIYLAEMCEALERIVRPACEHVEHDGGALTREQTVALMRLNDGIDAMTHKVSEALSERTSAAETSGGVLPVRRQRDDVLDLVRSVKEKFNPRLEVAGILLTMYQTRPQLCRSVRESVVDIYGGSYHVFERPIEYSIKVAECPAAGQSIFEYAPKNAAAESYRSLAREVLRLG